MANKEIKDFGAGSPALTDYLLSQTSAGVTQQYTAADLATLISANASYGDIYEATIGGGAGLSVGTSYVGWQTATSGTLAGAPYMTADVAHATADQLIIGASGAGLYFAALFFSFSGTGSTTFELMVHKTGAVTNIWAERKMGAAGDVGAGATGGLITLAAADTIDLRIKADAASKTLTPHNIRLLLVKLGT